MWEIIEILDPNKVLPNRITCPSAFVRRISLSSFHCFCSLFSPLALQKKTKVTKHCRGKRGRDRGQEGALVLFCVKLGPRQFEYSTVQHWPIFYI